MGSEVIAALVSVAVLLLAALLVWLRRREGRRRRALSAMAARLGLRFVEDGAWVLDRVPFLNPDRLGPSAEARNVLVGILDTHRVFALDYYPYGYAGGIDDDQHPAQARLLLELRRPFPNLRICPRDLAAMLHQPLGDQGIALDSVEFSRTFLVSSADKKFAYDICHARMMEYLLGDRKLSLEIEDAYLAMSFNRRLDVTEIPGRLRQLVAIRGLFPDYLFRD